MERNGEPLPDAVREKMEHSFGADFSDVRVHPSSPAVPIGARAFAHGDDVHFAPGQYSPESQSGQELLGHELTHVVQQRSGPVHPASNPPAHVQEANRQLSSHLAAGGLPANVR